LIYLNCLLVVSEVNFELVWTREPNWLKLRESDWLRRGTPDLESRRIFYIFFS